MTPSPATPPSRTAKPISSPSGCRFWPTRIFPRAIATTPPSMRRTRPRSTPARRRATSTIRRWRNADIRAETWRRPPRHAAPDELSPPLSREPSGATASVPDHHQAIGARFAAPRLARPPQHLAHVGAALVAREGGVALGRGIETLDGIGDPVGRPHPILVIDIDRIGAGLALRHRVDRPAPRGRIVTADRPRVAEAHPHHALGRRPDAPRPGPHARRLDDEGAAPRAVGRADDKARA